MQRLFYDGANHCRCAINVTALWNAELDMTTAILRKLNTVGQRSTTQEQKCIVVCEVKLDMLFALFN